jgi:cell wall-associated NlpC family hydrolase
MPQPPSPDHRPHIGPEGTPLNPGHRDESRGQQVVHEAAEQFGHPYMYGGDGPIAFDCSGLTKYVYAHVGVQLPHNAADQYGVVNHVAQSDKQLGDLIFIYDNQGIFHVGIYAGDGQMWAAGHTGDVVRKQPIWTDSYVVGRP